MLVLTRKLQEKIRIGDHITITVLRTKGKAVRLGIEAPADVPVIRGELAFDASRGESRREAAGVSTATGMTTAADTRQGSNTGRNRAHWPAESRHERAPAQPPATRHSEKPVAGCPPTTQVSFQRVPRRQLAGLRLPPTPSAGPLRAMLDRRSTTT